MPTPNDPLWSWPKEPPQSRWGQPQSMLKTRGAEIQWWAALEREHLAADNTLAADECRREIEALRNGLDATKP